MTDIPDIQAEAHGKGFWRRLFTFFLYLWAFLLLAIGVAALAGFIVYEHVAQPGRPGPKVELTVPEGAAKRNVGALLVEAGLIEYEGFFRFALRLDATDRPIRHGVYELPKGLSALELLELLYEGPSRQTTVDRFRITIPEGLSLAQMADLFDDPLAFRAAAADPALIARLDIEGPATLEGFLMPNTYFFDRKPTEQEVVERMVDQFEKEYTRLLAAIPGADRYDKLSIVTVASLIEEEARVSGERPLVAAVLYNRLEKGMPLQMDSTLQYALGKYGQRLLDSDKEVDSPYNTYRNRGLPPGPISSPGVDSLRAALAPAQRDYLYFVSNADGTTHTFSSTYDEHQRAVAKFRREIAVQRREQRESEGSQ